MNQRLEKISQFVHDYLAKTGEEHSGEPWGPEYRWEHTLRVTYWSFLLAQEENADTEQCVAASLFHDVSHFDCEDYRTHGIRSAEIAQDFLVKEGYPDKFVEAVVYAVQSHVGEKNPQTVEAKILQDADTLDRFGYIRILLFGKKADLLSLEKLQEDVTSFKEYIEKVERGDYGYMWTKTGKNEIEKLITLHKTVLSGVLQEIERTHLHEAYL